MAAIQKKPYAELQAKFKELTTKSADEQQELFLKSFIFALGENWKIVNELNKKYKKYLQDTAGNEGIGTDLNCVQAADFLQKNGVERTATQRKAEISDIDLDDNNRICFIEYLLLHFKRLILEEYYKRTGEAHKFDLSTDTTIIGVTGVGHQLLDELFTIPSGLDPELERAIEELTAVKKVRENKMKDLATQASAGGVKGGIASAQLAQMHQEENPELLKVEAKINSAMRKGGKQSGEQALKKKQDAEKKAADAKAKQSKDALRARISNMGLN